MWTVYKRLAELTVNKNRTKEEEVEMNQCLELNVKMVRDFANLENLSLVAYMSNDEAWHHEICAKIDNLHNKLCGMPYDEPTTKKNNKKNNKKQE